MMRGPFPRFASLTKLTWLSLEMKFGGLNNDVFISLQANQLTGKIPEDFTKCSFSDAALVEFGEQPTQGHNSRQQPWRPDTSLYSDFGPQQSPAGENRQSD